MRSQCRLDNDRQVVTTGMEGVDSPSLGSPTTGGPTGEMGERCGVAPLTEHLVFSDTARAWCFDHFIDSQEIPAQICQVERGWIKAIAARVPTRGLTDSAIAMRGGNACATE